MEMVRAPASYYSKISNDSTIECAKTICNNNDNCSQFTSKDQSTRYLINFSDGSEQTNTTSDHTTYVKD